MEVALLGKEIILVEMVLTPKFQGHFGEYWA
jgi:hypothetical protein